MSAEQNKAIIRRLLTELNNGNPDILYELCADDFVSHPPRAMGKESISLKERQQATGRFFSAFADFHHSIDDLIAEGDKVVAQMTASGIHQANFRGIPPTGQQVTFAATVIFRLADGKIVEEWANLDLLSLLQQLGAIPAAAQG